MQKKHSPIPCLLLVLLLCLSGCQTTALVSNKVDRAIASIVPFYDFNKTRLSSISIQSSANSNQNSPVAVDIVFIFDNKTAQVLSKLNGPDWFANKQSMLLQYQHQLALTQLEIVPQTPSQKVILPKYYFEAVNVLLFANYQSQAGQYQADITQYHQLKIRLNKHHYVLQDASIEDNFL